jgi:hypothetical protein
MFGQAALERVDTTAASKRVADRLGKSRDAQQEQEIEMDEKQLKEILSGFKAEMVEVVKSTVATLSKPAEKTEEKATDETPVFSGDATKPADLEAFAGVLKAHEINKSLKSGKMTAEQIVALAKSLSAVEPSDEDAGVVAGDSPEVIGLKRQLFKAQRTRNAPEGGASADEGVESIAKAAADEGRSIAAVYNEQRGSRTESGMRLVKS